MEKQTRLVKKTNNLNNNPYVGYIRHDKKMTNSITDLYLADVDDIESEDDDDYSEYDSCYESEPDEKHNFTSIKEFNLDTFVNIGKML